MKQIFFCMVTVLYTIKLFSVPFFAYDTAIVAANNQQWDDAHRLLQELVVDNPDNAELLYDAGVVAYKKELFQEAHAYFSNVIKREEHKQGSSALTQQAYFNKGNAAVALKRYEDALSSYEKVLALDSDNARARHNYEVVQKMLKDQKQQEDQREKEQEDNKESQQHKKSDNDDNQSKQADAGDSQQSDQSQESSEDNGTKEKKERSSKRKKNRENNTQSADQATQQPDEQHTEHNNIADTADSQRSEAQEEHKQEREGKEQESSKGNGGDARADSKHSNQPGSDAQGGRKQTAPEYDPFVRAILEKQDRSDAQLGREMIKANVTKQLAGQRGQQCW